jgi:cytochrome c-type biogenesis protein CcmH/NrfF
MCGGCPRERLSDCRCGFAANERQKIADRVAGMQLDLSKKEAQKQAYDAVVAMQVEKYGGKHVLAVPEDTAFNRLAWIVPYAAMGGGVVLIFFVARSFVRRGRAQTVAQATPAAPKTEHERDLEDKLDDELRDLD